MIYTYHRIKNNIDDKITITPYKFFLDMLKLVCKKVVHLNNYNPKSKKNVALTFDDGTKDFLKYALPILKFFHYPFDVCIVADFVSDNSGYFLNTNDLKNIVKQGGHLQYHGKSHKDLTTLQTDKEILEEIICPNWLKKLDCEGFQFFVYPFWNYNEKTEQLVNLAGYKIGLSGGPPPVLHHKDKTWFRIRKG